MMVSDLFGKLPGVAQFGLTDFPELPLVSKFEAFTTSQEDEGRFSESPY